MWIMARRTLTSRLLPRALSTGRVVGHLGVAAARRLARSGRRAQARADAEALGEALVGELDEMKGLAMKVGQILSYMDVGLPEGTTARLARLQRGADPLDVAVIRATVEAQLGAPMGELFERFDAEPVEAASIGQVHRARVGGEEVAVKVRYPSVAATLTGDFARLAPVARMAGLATAVDGQALLADLRDRMIEECDYRREAAWLERFGGVVAPLPDVSVVSAVSTHCAEGVLTTRWATGVPLSEPVPIDQRAAVAEALAAFLFTSVSAGLLHGDPHPGNVLVQPQGIVMLDFGAVVELPVSVVDGWFALIEAVRADDVVGLRRVAVDQGLTPRPERVDWPHLLAFWRFLLRPALPGVARYDRALLTHARRFSQPGDPNLRVLALPPPWLWLQRALWGLSAVLCRLGGEEGLCVGTAHRLPAR